MSTFAPLQTRDKRNESVKPASFTTTPPSFGERLPDDEEQPWPIGHGEEFRRVPVFPRSSPTPANSTLGPSTSNLGVGQALPSPAPFIPAVPAQAAATAPSLSLS